ncbi:very long chain fatty acid elongase 4-like [Liolophura sinensis]|uniref:very long chain fatty acid elongase 4-like n=1 Tax=Liolophura sinensis TaxID=3198878 RepID=UPI0031594929
MMALVKQAEEFYGWMIEKGDPRVDDWLLMKTPFPIIVIFFAYIGLVIFGPKIMKNQSPFNLKWILVPYNFFCVGLSAYMFYEFVVTSVMSGYSYICQPVDYSQSPLALRMASVCWWFFFSKVIELLDTAFFILRKKTEQISFLHVYHHCTMIMNWWLGVKYVAGGQSFFVAMLNSFVHIIMYTYYGCAAIGPHMQKYLWWKRYLTRLQLLQFILFVVHTTTNLLVECDYPQGYNIAVFIYAISLIILFGNFYYKSYVAKRTQSKKD